MKTGAITYKLTIILFAITTLLISFAALTIWHAWQDKNHAHLHESRNELTKHFHHLASTMAMERGIGNTILGGDQSLLHQFKSISTHVNREMMEVQNHLTQYTQIISPSPDFIDHIKLWNHQFDNIRNIRPKIINASITSQDWQESMTQAILSSLTLSNLIFSPNNENDAAIYYNAIIRPHIALLVEFAGRERSLISFHLAKTAIIDPETIPNLQLYRDRVEQAVEKLVSLKNLSTSPPKLKEAIQHFEEIFLGSYQKLRLTIYTINQQMTQSLQQKRTELTTAANTIKSLFSSIKNDLHGLTIHPVLQKTAVLLHSKQPADLTLVQNLFANMLNVEQDFFQISYLDQSGQQKIRVDYKNNQAQIIPIKDLTNEQNQDYFIQSKSLSALQMYISPITITNQNQQTIPPFNPFFRILMPIFVKGQRLGTLVTHFNGQIILDTTPKGALLIDQNGFYMRHPDQNKEWGMIPELNRPTQTLFKDFATTAPQLLADTVTTKTINNHYLLTQPVHYHPSNPNLYWSLIQEIDTLPYPTQQTAAIGLKPPPKPSTPL